MAFLHSAKIRRSGGSLENRKNLVQPDVSSVISPFRWVANINPKSFRSYYYSWEVFVVIMLDVHHK